MNWKGRKVLVTGAGGFIGSHLAEELARRGAKVRALVRYNSRSDEGLLAEADPALRRRMEVVAGDVTDAHHVLRIVEGQEVVFHLAALIAIPYSYHAPASFTAVNVGGTLNVLEACRRAKTKRVIHTSTSEVYGTALYTPIDEKHPLQGQSPYSASKIGADHIAESFHRSFGLPLTIVRPFNTYGPRQSGRAVIPTIVAQLLAEKDALALGELTPVRDFNYVGDTVSGFLAAADAPKAVGETINLGTGRGVSVLDTARLAMRLLGREVKIRRESGRMRPAKSEVFKLLCDNRKARRLCGWRPQVSLEQGLVRAIDYIRRRSERYRGGAHVL